MELKTRRQVRQKIVELLDLSSDLTMTTSEIRQQLSVSLADFGSDFTTQLVRSLERDDEAERQSIVWLLTVLDDPTCILPLQEMARNERLSRAIRLSASLTLAGLGVTAETIERNRRVRLYAIR